MIEKSRASAADGVNDESIAQLGEEILRYLNQHAEAADTFDGIVEWWIVRQRLYEAKNKVERAVEALIEAKKVQVRQLADGRKLICKKQDNPD